MNCLAEAGELNVAVAQSCAPRERARDADSKTEAKDEEAEAAESKAAKRGRISAAAAQTGSRSESEEPARKSKRGAAELCDGAGNAAPGAAAGIPARSASRDGSPRCVLKPLAAEVPNDFWRRFLLNTYDDGHYGPGGSPATLFGRRAPASEFGVRGCCF